jgi:hypothetical protein
MKPWLQSTTYRYGPGNQVVRRGAKLGRTFTFKLTTKDGWSVTGMLKLRGERKGDDSGKPFGC